MNDMISSYLHMIWCHVKWWTLHTSVDTRLFWSVGRDPRQYCGRVCSIHVTIHCIVSNKPSLRDSPYWCYMQWNTGCIDILLAAILEISSLYANLSLSFSLVFIFHDKHRPHKPHIPAPVCNFRTSMVIV